MQLIDEIMKRFKEQQVVQFATSDKEQPRVRPMSLIYMNKHFYMITGARGGKDAKKLQQPKVRVLYEP